MGEDVGQIVSLPWLPAKAHRGSLRKPTSRAWLCEKSLLESAQTDEPRMAPYRAFAASLGKLTVCPTLAMNTLNNKIALVTGGGRGIGEACAVALAEAGADVAVCSRSSGEIDAVAEKIRATGRRALAVVCDVTEADQVRRMAEDVNSQFGVVEILVNNAGLGRSHRFVDHPDELWDQMLAVNLTSVY